MGLSTHVLDTMHGTPAAGMEVVLFTTEGTGEDARATLVRRFTLNADGRSDEQLFDNNSLKTGTYRLVFDVAGYFKARGLKLPEPNFLNRVALDFGVAHTDQHYHVPLLVATSGATPPTGAPETRPSLAAALLSTCRVGNGPPRPTTRCRSR